MIFCTGDRVTCTNDDGILSGEVRKGGVYTVLGRIGNSICLDGVTHPVFAGKFQLCAGDNKAEEKEAKTGDRFNAGKTRWRNFPLFLLEDLMTIGTAGEAKYGTYNFLGGAYVNDLLDAAKRHIMKGESPYYPDIDEESKVNHFIHAAWNLLVAAHMMKVRPDLDDRYKLEGKKADENN